MCIVYCLLAVISFIFTTLVPNLFCCVQIHVFFFIHPNDKRCAENGLKKYRIGHNRIETAKVMNFDYLNIQFTDLRK